MTDRQAQYQRVYLAWPVLVMQLELARELVFTDGLAVVGRRVNLVTLLTLAFVTADLVDADLAACVRVGTLVDICYIEKEQKSDQTSIDH